MKKTSNKLNKYKYLSRLEKRKNEKIIHSYSSHMAQSEIKDASWHIYDLKTQEFPHFLKAIHIQKGLSLGAGYIFIDIPQSLPAQNGILGILSLLAVQELLHSGLIAVM